MATRPRRPARWRRRRQGPSGGRGAGSRWRWRRRWWCGRRRTSCPRPGRRWHAQRAAPSRGGVGSRGGRRADSAPAQRPRPRRSGRPRPCRACRGGAAPGRPGRPAAEPVRPPGRWRSPGPAGATAEVGRRGSAPGPAPDRLGLAQPWGPPLAGDPRVWGERVGDAGGPPLVGSIATPAGLGIGLLSLAVGLLGTAAWTTTRRPTIPT
jgi:hypothetical protein